MPSASRTPWLLALGACLVAGVGFGLANAHHTWLPARMGYVIAALAWLGGLAFGSKAVWLPFAGIASFGLTTFIADTISPPQGDDQRALVVLFLTVLPALFMVPAVLGAGMRRLLNHRSC